MSGLVNKVKEAVKSDKHGGDHTTTTSSSTEQSSHHHQQHEPGKFGSLTGGAGGMSEQPRHQPEIGREGGAGGLGGGTSQFTSSAGDNYRYGGSGGGMGTGTGTATGTGMSTGSDKPMGTSGSAGTHSMETRQRAAGVGGMGQGEETSRSGLSSGGVGGGYHEPLGEERGMGGGIETDRSGGLGGGSEGRYEREVGAGGLSSMGTGHHGESKTGKEATGYNDPEGTHGPHSSRAANVADPRIDSDRDNRGATGTESELRQHDKYAEAGGIGGGLGGTGSQSLGQEREMRGREYEGGRTHEGGLMGASGSGGANTAAGQGPAPKTAGPHGSDLLNKADPRVDSNLDGSKTVGGDKTYQSGSQTGPAKDQYC